MTDTKTIQLIAQWINDSVSAAEIDCLVSHVAQAKVDTDLSYEVGEQFLDALFGAGYEA